MVFGGIGVIAFFTVFGTCLGTRTSSPSNQTSAFPSATPPPTPTVTPDPNATPTPTPAPTATPVQRQFAAAPTMSIDPERQYVATITTEKGSIRVQLDPKAAPQAVNSFVFLANSHYYDGLTFNRVGDFFAQGGDAGSGAPGYSLPLEPSPLPHDAGMLALARNNIDNTLTGQFYIMRKPLPNQNGKDTVIGKVVSGQDVVDQLTPTDPSVPNAPVADKIVSITIDERPAT